GGGGGAGGNYGTGGRGGRAGGHLRGAGSGERGAGSGTFWCAPGTTSRQRGASSTPPLSLLTFCSGGVLNLAPQPVDRERLQEIPLGFCEQRQPRRLGQRLRRDQHESTLQFGPRQERLPPQPQPTPLRHVEIRDHDVDGTLSQDLVALETA